MWKDYQNHVYNSEWLIKYISVCMFYNDTGFEKVIKPRTAYFLNFPVWTSAILARCFNSSEVACTADNDSNKDALYSNNCYILNACTKHYILFITF